MFLNAGSKDIGHHLFAYLIIMNPISAVRLLTSHSGLDVDKRYLRVFVLLSPTHAMRVTGFVSPYTDTDSISEAITSKNLLAISNSINLLKF
ncbi:Unannotated [Lentimonas sp. CC4]|nr:Unannotated [Lentimonas sp. CC4]CAA6683895.1 Unannotated [Lentimonas sp. CC6]CAA7076727.1 Unannotated [Lentimonas sp. CC4]CAA7169938.1 Unannotated [Lentimonas sp. CC21]CAA7181226.1 Unannotated [Lentimonas sp. CC8]